MPAGFWVLLLLAAAIRLPGIGRPLLGHFATKNVTYAMIARNWALGRASIWHPTVDCLAGGERGWHLLEFPVAAYVAGAGWKCCGGSLDVWGRGTSIAFSVAAVGLLWLLVRRWHGTSAAWGAGFLLALSPISIVFGQSFMLEPSLVFFSVAALWCLDTWLLGRRAVWLVLVVASLAALLLTKIYMLVFLLPLTSLVVRQVYRAGALSALGLRGFFTSPHQPEASARSGDGATSLTLRVGVRAEADRRFWQFALAIVLSVLPAALWYAGAWHAAAPDRASSEHIYFSVRQSAATHHVPNPLLTSLGFYSKLLSDLSGPVLSPLGFVLLLAGLFHPAFRRHGVWLAAMLLLVAVLPKKFFELTYYHMAILPLWCVLAGLGWQMVVERVGLRLADFGLRIGPINHRGWATAGLLLAGGAISLRYAYAPAFLTPREDRGVLAAAQAARDLAGADEPILTLHGAAPDLLYYCDRPGWALSTNDPHLADKLARGKRAGVRWLVVADLAALAARPPATAVLSGYRVICTGDDYRIYELSPRHAAATRR